jgi:hypothetical protein
MPRRELNGEEIALVRKIRERGHAVPAIQYAENAGVLTVEFRKRGRVTLAMLRSMYTEEESIGVSVMSKEDRAKGIAYSEPLGERIAFAKAISTLRCL